MNFQKFKLDLENEEEPEIKLPTSVGSLKKEESSRKTSISALLTTPEPLTVWITTNWKILGDGNTRPPDLPPEKPVCRSGNKLELDGTTDWFQIGKGVCQCCILSPCLFNLYAESVSQFSRSVVSDSLRPHESQHARPPCPSQTPRVYSNSCPLRR